MVHLITNIKKYNNFNNVMCFLIKRLHSNIPVDTGNKFSLLICVSIQSISSETYWGAGNGVGFLYLSLSAHKYSNFGPPLMVGQDVSVQ